MWKAVVFLSFVHKFVCALASECGFSANAHFVDHDISRFIVYVLLTLIIIESRFSFSEIID